MPESAFSVAGLALPAGQDPLGLWQVPERPARDEAVAFSVGEAQAPAEPEAPTWRVSLPESPEAAQAVLQRQSRAMELAQRDLQRVERQLTAFDPQKEEAGVSFSAADELSAPKSELLRSIARYQPAPETEVVAYGLFSWRKEREKAEADEAEVEAALAPEDRQTMAQWYAFMEQVRRTVGNYAHVETEMGEVMVGSTAVGWTGDFTTTWAMDVAPVAMRVHTQSVHLALASRIALLRIVSVVTTGAAGLALKAAVPGGQVLLLPASWRFVRDVLAELRRSWPQLKYLS